MWRLGMRVAAEVADPVVLIVDGDEDDAGPVGSKAVASEEKRQARQSDAKICAYHGAPNLQFYGSLAGCILLRRFQPRQRLAIGPVSADLHGVLAGRVHARLEASPMRPHGVENLAALFLDHLHDRVGTPLEDQLRQM